MKKSIILFFIANVLVLLLLFLGCTQGGGSSGGGSSSEGDDGDKNLDPFVNILYRDMVSITGGNYTQQSDVNVDGDVLDANESFSHTISNFSIGKYEVTYELWFKVYQWAISNGYNFANAGREGNDGSIGAIPTSAKFEPVTFINWRDAIVWCNAYSQMAGFTPVYNANNGYSIPIKDSRDGIYGSSINSISGSFDNPYINWSANGYRLPTEGEWQFASSNKGGTPFNYASGATTFYNNTADTIPANGVVDGKDTNDLVAIYGYYWNGSWISMEVTKTENVGTKQANALTIYDMSGNIWEWCWDWNDTYPGGTNQTNYRGVSSGIQRIRRGGAWLIYASFCQVGSRISHNPYDEVNYIGIRLSMSN